ncbi:hypothetical protein BCR33DRAFT_854886 [Rhizoclosmatium globosum]|uniref:Hydrophobin n=1 Tax=Rhizoclosmatium globosum TaxID=329046 RepID=A0A1Y2BQJ2_9FUNG|nr:hypothetical protein BCR33DRAFT_854886 [Rhizoclosmatium globosum]|eukprot:ORY37008.1 hypothetical protein BCR33DRAFT_854886 [Rhizoclosmatium globosum]
MQLLAIIATGSLLVSAVPAAVTTCTTTIAPKPAATTSCTTTTVVAPKPATTIHARPLPLPLLLRPQSLWLQSFLPPVQSQRLNFTVVLNL